MKNMQVFWRSQTVVFWTVPPERLVVTESGIPKRADVELRSAHGVHAFLDGEAFMRATDPGVALETMFGVPDHRPELDRGRTSR